MEIEKSSVNPSSLNLPKDPVPETDPKTELKSKDRSSRSRSSSRAHKSHSRSKHHRHHKHRHHHRHRHSKHRSSSRSRHRSRHYSRSTSRSKSRNRSRTRNPSKPSDAAPALPGSPSGANVARSELYNGPQNLPIKPPPVSKLDLNGTGSGLKPTTLLQSKYERELYIGNLPPGLTNNQLAELLNHALIRLGAVTEPGDPIVNAWVGGDGRYAFVVFRSIEETNKALALKGVSIMGYQIKVSKIKMTARPNYHGGISSTSLGTLPLPNESLGKTAPKTVGEVSANSAGYKMMEKLQVSHLPPAMTKEQIEKLMSIFGKVVKVEIILDPVTKTPNGQCFVEFSNEVELQKAAAGALGMKLGDCVLETKKVPISQTADTLAIGILIKNAAGQLATNPEAVDALIGLVPKMNSVLETHPSRVVKLKNLVNVAELFDNAYHDELIEDINEQCQRYGKILEIEVPRPKIQGPQVPGVGFVFVQYETVDQAMTAVKELNGLLFAGKKVEAVYYPEDSFKKRVLDL
eukprot:TRINITY_DN3152_c0_g1_i1.p1 TRINITY_DN3152_c0_g1~~TRINITY_DN3152_c0_g1_i1.p1  ORF type:complete len:519 (+),score=45.92 TRINITY_DN3152_c0_g1_i1:123-1679(+)